MDLLADLPQENISQRVIPEEQTMDTFNLFEGYNPAPAQTPDVRARPLVPHKILQSPCKRSLIQWL